MSPLLNSNSAADIALCLRIAICPKNRAVAHKITVGREIMVALMGQPLTHDMFDYPFRGIARTAKCATTQTSRQTKRFAATGTRRHTILVAEFHAVFRHDGKVLIGLNGDFLFTQKTIFRHTSSSVAMLVRCFMLDGR